MLAQRTARIIGLRRRSMSGRTLRFVESRPPSWSPAALRSDVVVLAYLVDARRTGPAGIVPIRPVVERILADTDFVNGSLQRLDAWDAESGLADQSVVDGATSWFNILWPSRWDLHELMIWQRVLAELHHRDATRRSRPRGDARRSSCGPRLVRCGATSISGRSPGPHIVTRHARRDLPELYRRFRRSVGPLSAPPVGGRCLRDLTPPRANPTRPARKEDRPCPRVGTASRPGSGLGWSVPSRPWRRRRSADRLLSLVRPATVRGSCASRWSSKGSTTSAEVIGLRSPNGASCHDRRSLDGAGLPSARHQHDGDVGDGQRPALQDVRPVPLVVDGVDLGPAMDRVVAGYDGHWLEAQIQATAAAERFLGDLRPDVLYLDREGTRTHWIVAAQRRGIPVVAIQHGMIYPGNPEYCRPAHPATPRPEVTCVFGEAERGAAPWAGWLRGRRRGRDRLPSRRPRDHAPACDQPRARDRPSRTRGGRR